MAHPLPDPVLDRLVDSVKQTNLTVLNKILWHCDCSHGAGYYRALQQLVFVRDKMQQAAAELLLCL